MSLPGRIQAHPVRRFVRAAFATQVATVRGRLDGSREQVLEQHRAALEKWTGAAEEALRKTRAVGGPRGQLWQAREELAEALTRERDALHDALSERARQSGLPRDWPDRFFRRESDSERPAMPSSENAAPAGPPPA